MRFASRASLASLVSLATLALVACAGEPPPPPAPVPPPSPSAPPAPPPPAAPAYSGISRADFNRNAVRANLPVYWANDADHDGVIDPEEAVSLLFYPTTGHWVQGGAFTPEFDRAWQTIKAAGTLTAANPPTPEDTRRALVVKDLDQGLPTLVANDFSGASPADKAFVVRMLAVGRMIDDLYAIQNGAKALASSVAAGDDASQSLFRRDRGPRCEAPLTEKEPLCNAISGSPKQVYDAYPADLQKDPNFCVALEKLPGAKALLEPFVAIRANPGGKLVAVPFSEAYKEPMTAVARGLEAAAAEVTDASEGPLKAYLAAAAKSFTTNDWVPADEAWSKMTVQNSKWYVRVAPDETYWEPCNHKAGFHLTFARINRDSLAWQAKLDPFEQEMEQNLATRIGAFYKARKVSFHLPDFIDIIVNAGDDRAALGGTIGQSLPNWGPVSAQGRGRTVAMSNLFIDTDSVAIRRKQAESLLSKETIASYVDSKEPGLLDTILHEATHNLGPAHEYKWQGKTDSQAFGGQLASMLEELKAQTGGLYFVDFAVKKGLLTPEAARESYVSNLVWAFGHISRGMYTDTHARKAYSQLAAIQVGFLLDAGAITFDPNAKAADGSVGAFAIQFDKMPAAIEKLMAVVGAIKAKADKAGAMVLVTKYVDGARVPQALIADRELKYPKQSLVYAVGL
jgi:hypothetical protein